MSLLAVASPAFQQFQDHLFLLLRRVRLGKIFIDLLAGQGDAVKIAFLFLGHDGPHHINGQMTFLAEFL